MNTNNQQDKTPVGLLLVIGDIISNDQRDEICTYLEQSFKYINHDKYHEINDLFNNLIHPNAFQQDCQYRQMANTENGSVAGFLYLPNFHTLLNVLKDLFNTCYHVCIIYSGQQIDSNGALILSDSSFTCENFYSLFEENPSYLIQDLQLILPFVSNQWKKLSNNHLEKHLQNVQINDLSTKINQDNSFGRLFYERLIEILNDPSVDFDINTKLIPRDTSGTIAFDEPNLYILYGQQGEASLFGIRGFVVLVNGGYSRIPSYWNLIRGLQTIDACVLTHFDYDVFPGLQTILHRKTIPSIHDGPSCKPDIGAIFINNIQRNKLQSVSSANSKLSINLNENIEEFLNNTKQLHINTFDLIKHTINNKTNTIEPINLYKKIAFGSLDLYILHPTASTSEDEKMIAGLQKIPIRDQTPSTSIVPLHHWYSSCSLLVWTPTSKSNKDSLVRILYTGACPQTLVFEALNKVRTLEFLNEFQQPQQQTNRVATNKTAPAAKSTPVVKYSLQKPKVSLPVTKNRVPSSSSTQNKTTKTVPNPVASKPKVSQTTTRKAEKPRTAPAAKKAPSAKPDDSTRPINKEKKTPKPRGSTPKESSKPKQVKSHAEKPKKQDVKPQKSAVQDKHKEETKTPIETEQKQDIADHHESKLEAQNELEEELETRHDPGETQEIHDDNEPILQSKNEPEEDFTAENESKEELVNVNGHEQFQESENEPKEEEEIANENGYEQNQQLENEVEQNPDTEINDEKKSEDQQNIPLENGHEEQPEDITELTNPADESNENNEATVDNHEDELQRPESVSLNDEHKEPLIESNTASPMDEIKTQSDSYNPMTTGFIDGEPNTENPFVEKTDHHEDDEMEIVQHDISPTNKQSVPSDEDIHPQGLPIENNIHSKKSTTKNLTHGSNRTNGLSASANSINQISSQKSKSTSSSSSSNSIFNVDVAYIPYHGDEHYVDSEFFRRIRARYYILNAVQINRLTLESLIEGKQQWGTTEHIPITLVPTFDGESLRQFFLMNKNRLAELNINILPASTRCNVQYDDEGSPAQRLRFNSMYDTDE